jgi:hypothetical protein
VNADINVRYAHVAYRRNNATYEKILTQFSLSSDPQNIFAAVAIEINESLLMLERGNSGLLSRARGNLTRDLLDIK